MAYTCLHTEALQYQLEDHMHCSSMQWAWLLFRVTGGTGRRRSRGSVVSPTQQASLLEESMVFRSSFLAQLVFDPGLKVVVGRDSMVIAVSLQSMVVQSLLLVPPTKLEYPVAEVLVADSSLALVLLPIDLAFGI